MSEADVLERIEPNLLNGTATRNQSTDYAVRIPNSALIPRSHHPKRLDAAGEIEFGLVSFDRVEEERGGLGIEEDGIDGEWTLYEAAEGRVREQSGRRKFLSAW